MPRPPRAPTSPSPARSTSSSRPPRLPPLRLAPLRDPQSRDLDTERTRGGHGMPPFVRFDHFMAEWRWRVGEHLTIIGPTGSGKTVLARQLLRRRDFVVVLGVKNRDPELYGPFERDGYELVHQFDPLIDDADDYRRLLYVPLSDKQDVKEMRREKSRKFRQAISDLMRAGKWTVFADEVAYMVDQLQLSSEFEELWRMGRSEQISVVAASQEPVNIPVMAYGMATHLFLFKNPDLVRARRMAELTGLNREITQETILRLPDHEFLYVNKGTGKMLRSRVIR